MLEREIPMVYTGGFLVADVRGRLVGRVISSMCGNSSGEPDSVAVRSRLLRRHFIVPRKAIATIDGTSRVIGLRLPREELQRFL